MKRLILTVFLALAATPTQASERWVSFETICDSSPESMRHFYKSENLSPLIGGGGLIPLTQDDWQPAVHYIMWDQDDSIAVIRYVNGEACLLAVLRNLEWDTETLLERLP